MLNFFKKLSKIKKALYLYLLTIILYLVFGMQLKQVAFDISIQGLFNFFIYLGEALFPATIATIAIICSVLLIKLLIYCTYVAFFSKNIKDKDDCFAYTIDKEYSKEV